MNKNVSFWLIWMLALMVVVSVKAESGETGALISDQISQTRANSEVPFDYIHVRDKLLNCSAVFLQNKQGRVAFIGGSITENQGWRDHVSQSLQRRFPQCEFDFVNAGIGSTDSTLGAFRIQNDVFCKGKVDLLFVEYAVNDQANFRTSSESVRAMEGIVRKTVSHNPYIDIVFLYFYDPDKKKIIDSGRVPPVIASHESVAEYYNISSIDCAKLVSFEIKKDGAFWDKFGANIHPSPFGGRVYADAVETFLDMIWDQELPENGMLKRHEIPQQCLDPLNYSNGVYVEPNQAELIKGWQHVITWSPKNGTSRKRFSKIALLEANEPNALLRLEFTGSAVGLFLLAGPDVGILEYRIDEEQFKCVDQYTQWSQNLHLPRVIMLDADLHNGKHELTLRTINQKNSKSRGYTSRIVTFLVNEAGNIPP